ncbi:MAG TPA: type II toxin-antitoxin system RelE/ParE family toxin [Gemmataceae bacterium]|nr:type II toxin-antitoxin system RelE/ParE family toxin [Gemmataceae bacterium]
MPQVTRTTQAESDLIDILAQVGQRSVAAADRLADQIDRQCQQLARFPGMGRKRDDLAPGLVSFPVGKYLILYRIITGGIEVARVVYGGRDLTTLVFP